MSSRKRNSHSADKLVSILSYYQILKTRILKKYDPISKAIEFHNAPQFQRGLKGGVGAGKTYTLAADDILVSYLNAPHVHLSTSPSFDNARITVLPTLVELCETSGLEYEWIISKNLFRIIHKDNRIANILILGSDKPHFMKGINAASGSMNEPFSQKREAFKIWWERIRVNAVRFSRTWAGTAEPDKMQWGWEYFKEEKIQREDLYAETISTYDNEHLPREYVKGLEEIYDEKHRQVYMLGKCINLTLGRVYYSFEKVVNTFKMTNINEEKFTDRAENLQVIISFDFNVDPMCAVEIIFDNMNGQLSPAYYQIKDYKVSSSRTDELCDIIIDDIKTRYDFSKTSFIITGDATGARSGTRSEFDDYELIKQKFEDLETNLNKSGIKLNISYIKPSTNPPVRDRVNFVNNLFEKRKLFIEETCKETIEDLNLVSWKKGAEKFSLDKSQKNLTHLSDALGYAVWNTKLFIYNDYLLSDMLTLHRDRWQWGRNFH